jgi:hypothetical protein
MFQVLTTIFFSAATLAALGVIASMLSDNSGDIRRALGFVPGPFVPSARVKVRAAARRRAGVTAIRATVPLRAAA